ncbi:MAG: Crp/Fnr family transcriptional regulator [Chitinophagales bacterium]|nr:Crp/Fnr family transcriptional regulator [Chitinophagales bacterium]
MQTPKLLLIEKVIVLKSLSIFADTPETILAEIAHLVEEVEVLSGFIIFKEGDIGNCMYIIFRGSVRIHKGGQTLTTFNEKEFFGELSLLDPETRSATATAATDCFLLKLDQEPMYDLFESRPEVVQGILKILCRRIRAINQKLFEMGQALPST